MKRKIKSASKHPNRPILKVKNLTFTYLDEAEPVLHDVELKLYPQEIRIIVGPSGSGKSTLVSAICGFIPHSIDGTLLGTVKIAGRSNQNRSIYEIAHDIGLVQQDPEAQLCTDDVYHEIAFALENFLIPSEEIDRRVSWVLQVLGIDHLKFRQLHTLSGGEKQKVVLASVLVLRPKVLVFDEPTANLDPKAAQEILRLIDKLRKTTKVAVLIVDHNPSQYYSIADHILVLRNGMIEHILSTHQYKKFDHQYYRPVFQVNNSKLESGDGNYIKPELISNNFPEKSLNRKTTNVDLLIDIRNLYFKYENTTILKNISFSIKRGEFIAIMGDNGSGKTTLIQNIIKLLTPSKGLIRYKFNGHKNKNTSKILNTRLWKNSNSTSELSKNIGFVFQNPNHMIFGNTIWDEVMLGPKNMFKDPRFAVKNAKKLLAAGGLLSYHNRHPILLSHGEKRRLNLASVLCYNPEIIIMDEPFIGQDPDNISKILEYLLVMVSQGKTVLMVTHRTDIVNKYCSRVLFLKSGELLIDDKPSRAFTKLMGKTDSAYVPTLFYEEGVKIEN